MADEDVIELDMSPRTTTGCRDCDARVDAELPGKCSKHRGTAPAQTRQAVPVIKASLPEADLTRSQASTIGRLFHDMAAVIADTRTKRAQAEAQARRQAVIDASTLEESLAIATRETESRARWSQAPVVVEAPTLAQQVNAHEVVIGAQAEGAGGLTGWVGHGELTRSTMSRLLDSAGLHDGWLPNPKSIVAHAGYALQALTQEGRVVRADRGGRARGSRVGCTDGRYREFAGRWIVGQANVRAGQVGDSFGEILLTVVVFSDGRMECVGDHELATRVQSDYERRLEQEVYPAAEVTMWLRSTLMSRCRAIRMGGNWFVPRAHCAEAEALMGAISQVWGVDWLPVPFLPLATSTQLLSGLTVGLAREVRDALADLAAQRTQAQKQGQADIGTRGAATVYKKLEGIAAKARGFADMLGPNHVATLRAELQAAIDTVKPLIDDISLRYAMLDL